MTNTHLIDYSRRVHGLVCVIVEWVGGCNNRMDGCDNVPYDMACCPMSFLCVNFPISANRAVAANGVDLLI